MGNTPSTTLEFVMSVPRRFLIFAVSASIALVCATPSLAGTLSESGWSPSSCGPKPEAQYLDLTNPDAYNASLPKVNQYRQAINSYLNCLCKEANGDIQAINKGAIAVQQAAKEANERILAEVQAAEKKFGK